MNEGLLLLDEQRKWFLEMEPTCDDYSVKIIEMTTKDLECFMNLVDKAAAWFGRLTPILKEVLWIKCDQTAFYATEKSFIKGRHNRCNRLGCLILRNDLSHPNLQQPPPDQSAAINKKILTHWRLR